MAWNIAVQNHLLSRSGYSPRWLLYIWALETNRVEAPIGIWSGEYDLSLTVDGTARVYASAADGMMPDQITYETGTTIRTQRITLNGVNPQALEILMGRIIRGRKAELHVAFFDPFEETLIGYERMWKGFVNHAPASVSAFGKQSTINIELASAFRALTRPMNLSKSDQSQIARSGDRGRRYGSVAAMVKTRWGLDD